MKTFRSNHLRRLGNHVSVDIRPDEDGYTGRQCPQSDCEGYFKIIFGTGIKEDIPCHCPYCGHRASHDHFWTYEQIDYARSVATRKIAEAFTKDLKQLEFEVKPPRGSFGIGMSMKVKRGSPIPIHHYREKKLETDVVCENCTLHYSVYGVFAFCPDCGEHNSLQILERNLDLIKKMLDIAESEQEIQHKMVENALEDCVSAFDGYGRELCRVHANTSSSPDVSANFSFQNLVRAREHVERAFGINLAAFVPKEDWKFLILLFQKRHVIAHKMGVIDEEYIRKSGDSNTVVGRKVPLSCDEVYRLVGIVSALSQNFSGSFAKP